MGDFILTDKGLILFPDNATIATPKFHEEYIEIGKICIGCIFQGTSCTINGFIACGLVSSFTNSGKPSDFSSLGVHFEFTESMYSRKLLKYEILRKIHGTNAKTH